MAKAPTLSDLDRQRAEMEAQRKDTLAPLAKRVLDALDGAGDLIAELEAVRGDLGATNEAQAVDTLLRTIGHTRNVFRRATL